MEPLSPAGDACLGRDAAAGAKARAKDDPQPQALACYGLLRTDQDRVLLRFVEGRPVSRITTAFLAWGAGRLAEDGKKRVWVLVWDNAAWPVSRAVQAWIGMHNRTVKRTGGVRILVCRLPVKSPGSTRSSRAGCTASERSSSRIGR